MRLEIGAFHVKDIKFGDKTGYSNGILTVNKEELLKVVKEDEHITTADLRIVHPGDEVVRALDEGDYTALHRRSVSV